MNAPSSGTTSGHWQRAFWVVATLVLLVGGLYAARAVCVPVVLALLLTFVFAPVVAWLQQRGLGRILAVLATVGVAFVLLGTVLVLVFLQMKSLALALPEHKGEIAQKVAQLRGAFSGSWLDDVSAAVQEALKEAEALQAEGKKRAGEPPPIPVRISPSSWDLWTTAAPALDLLVSAGLVVILLIFMLVRREDLRNRLIRLSGDRHLTRMTRALDDAAGGISHFLFMQFIINGSYGLVLGLGLFALGVPYSVLWGFVAAVLRYIPYLGPWIGALFPLTISVAVMPTWWTPALALGLIVVVELLTGNFAEPVLYGQSLGISEVALLISAVFWTWLWGPVGLVLATPLTTCLLVLGRSVPALSFLSILLGDEPPLTASTGFYQRLLARDQDEAVALLEEQLRGHPVVSVFDEIVLPALVRVRQDQAAGNLAEPDAAFIHRVTAEWLGDLESALEFGRATGGNDATEEVSRLLGWASDDAAAQLALRMLRHVLRLDNVGLEILPATLSAEQLEGHIQEHVRGICLVGVLPQALSPLRYLHRRLQAQAPQLPVLACIWGYQAGMEKIADTLAGPNGAAIRLVSTLTEMHDMLKTLSGSGHDGYVLPVGTSLRSKWSLPAPKPAATEQD